MNNESKIIRSESIAKIAPALIKARKMVEIARKNAVNPHLKNRYADLGAVLDAIDQAMEECNLVPFQTPVASDDGKLHLESIIIHESGEYIGGTVVMPLSKQDPQGYGSAATYARRYALASQLNVTQDDDDGERAIARREGTAMNPCLKAQQEQMDVLLKEYGRTWEQLSDVYPKGEPYKGRPMSEVTTADMAAMISFVQGRIDEHQNK